MQINGFSVEEVPYGDLKAGDVFTVPGLGYKRGGIGVVGVRLAQQGGSVPPASTPCLRFVDLRVALEKPLQRIVPGETLERATLILHGSNLDGMSDVGAGLVFEPYTVRAEDDALGFRLVPA